MVSGSVLANAANGGVQRGQAGNGGMATTKVIDNSVGIGGPGGSVGITGKGGGIGFFDGQILMSADTDLTVNGDVMANGASGGLSLGKAGSGGTGIHVGGDAGILIGTGGGSGGAGPTSTDVKIKLFANGTLTVGGVISSVGGSGGSQTGATTGSGADARDPQGVLGPNGYGGNGGSFGPTGVGGNGGNILLTYHTKGFSDANIFTTGGTGGAQLPASAVGPFGQGTHQNGTPGTAGVQGVDGADGTITQQPIGLGEVVNNGEFVVDTDEE
jgi:hypothetical protein